MLPWRQWINCSLVLHHGKSRQIGHLQFLLLLLPLSYKQLTNTCIVLMLKKFCWTPEPPKTPVFFNEQFLKMSLSVTRITGFEQDVNDICELCLDWPASPLLWNSPLHPPARVDTCSLAWGTACSLKSNCSISLFLKTPAKHKTDYYYIQLLNLPWIQMLSLSLHLTLSVLPSTTTLLTHWIALRASSDLIYVT